MLCMEINVSVQYNGGSLPDIRLLTPARLLLPLLSLLGNQIN